MPTEQDFLNAKTQAETRHMAPGLAPNPAGRAMAIDIGPRIKGDVIAADAETCLRFYVERKIDPMAAVDERFRADEKVYGVPMDVIETGRIVSFQAGPGSSIGLDQRKLPPNVDPARTGTLSAVVKILNDYYVLGSNHAMAVNGRAVGSRIVFRPADRFIDDPGKFVFARITDHVHLTPARPNQVDCALAKIEDEFLDRVNAEFPKRIVRSAAGIEPAVGMKVRRVDESEEATGVIVGVTAQRRFDFSFGSYDFENLILIESEEHEWDKPFARPGDSGALVAGFDKASGEFRATAIIMGGSIRELKNGKWKSYTLACSYNRAIAKLEAAVGGQVVDRPSTQPGAVSTGNPVGKPEIEMVFKLPRPPAKAKAPTPEFDESRITGT